MGFGRTTKNAPNSSLWLLPTGSRRTEPPSTIGRQFQLPTRPVSRGPGTQKAQDTSELLRPDGRTDRGVPRLHAPGDTRCERCAHDACVQTISHVCCRNCADSTSQPEAPMCKGKLPHWIGWVMAKKGNHTLPNVGIVFASKEIRHRRATDTEIVGRSGSCTEEEEPRGTAGMRSCNNLWESTVDWSRGSSKSPNQSFASVWVRQRAASNSAA